MPVVATMTAIAVFRGRGNQRLPYFDDEHLRELLEEALSDDPNSTLYQARAIADKLERLLSDYRTSVDTSLDTYIEESANHYTSAADLIALIEPSDRERAETLRKVIELRQALLALLAEQQWETVFE
jgi:hypothetical protein